jgi:tRNA(fMet)-specific endonuclease VapC
MILLDTDHVSVLKYPSTPRARNLLARMALTPEPVQVPVVAAEEQMKGWLASIAKERSVLRQPGPYRELAKLFRFFAAFTVVDFEDPAAAKFDELRKAKVRIGTQDLKIACIALVNDALLLTANRQDFEQVPGLRFENWLDNPPA